MKLSRLIELATTLKEKHGDMDVMANDGWNIKGFGSYVVKEYDPAFKWGIPLGHRVAIVVEDK